MLQQGTSVHKTKTSGSWPRLLQKGWFVCLSSSSAETPRRLSNSVLMVVGGFLVVLS